MKDNYHNTGYFYCKKCKTYIKVLSKSRHQGWVYPSVIQNCPQCLNKKIDMIQPNKFDDLKHDVWISVKKDGIKYSLKWK